MEYVLEDNRVILNGNDSIRVVWFKDLEKFTVSGTTLSFRTKFGKVMIDTSTLTAYNGWGEAPSVTTIYDETNAAIVAFNDTPLDVNVVGDSSVLGASSPYRVVSDRDPTVNDDITFGHTKTVQWLNTLTIDLFECLDNTAGAAVWIKIQYIHL